MYPVTIIAIAVPAASWLYLYARVRCTLDYVGDLGGIGRTSDCGGSDSNIQVVGQDILQLVERVARKCNSGRIAAEDGGEALLEWAAAAVTHIATTRQQRVTWDYTNNNKMRQSKEKSDEDNVNAGRARKTRKS